MQHDVVDAWQPGGDGGSVDNLAIGEPEGVVSLRAEVPEHLLQAMGHFIERHPNWDQYRLFQAALAGFLVQNGVQNRGVTRCYLANLFPGAGGFEPLPGAPARSGPSPLPRRNAPRSERPWASDHGFGPQHHAA